VTKLPPHHFEDGTAWYALRTKNKSEHIAAATLRQFDGVETFCPRIRYQKATRRGKVLFHQAMFPAYLFARFDLQEQYRVVIHARGITGMVHFGEQRPAIDPNLITFLRQEIGEDEVKTLKPCMEPGDEIEIANGPFRGLRAIVRHYMPAKDRVQVLMEMLGNDQVVSVGTQDLVSLSYQ